MIYRDLRERVGLESRDGVRVTVLVKEAAKTLFFFFSPPLPHARLKCVVLSEQKRGGLTFSFPWDVKCTVEVGAAGFSSLIFRETVLCKIALSPSTADKPCSQTPSRGGLPTDWGRR